MCGEAVERRNRYGNRYVVRIEIWLLNSHSSGGENIAVILGTYQPDVQCRGSFGPWTSCRSVLGDMPTLTRPEIFGPQDDPTVQVTLPQFIESGQ